MFLSIRFSCFFAIFFLLVPTDVCSQSFKPSDLTGLTIWYRADTGITFDSNRVAVWGDGSGNTFDALQSDTSRQPVFVPNTLNGYPSIRFYDDYLSTGAFSIQTRTEFIIIRKNGPSISPYHNIMGYEFSPYYQLYVFDADQHFLSFIGGTGVDHQLLFEDKFQIIGRIVYADSVRLYQNGTAGTMGLLSAPLSNQPMHIGTYAPSAPRYLNGDIAEIIIYNKELSSAESMQVETYLRNKYAPPVNLGPDISINYGFCDTTLNTGGGFSSYLWSTGDSTSSIKVRNSGSYWVEVMDVFGKVSRDTIVVSNTVYPVQLADSMICSGQTIKWNTGMPKNGYSFLWQDASTDSVLTIGTAGSYWVTITDSLSCKNYLDTITISVDTFATYATLGPDTTLCAGNQILLQKGAPSAKTYLWSDGSTGSALKVDTAGTYSVSVTSMNGCIKYDTIVVAIKGKTPDAKFSAKDTCKGNNTIFTDLSSPPSGSAIIAWQWYFGDGDSSLLVNPVHLYSDTGAFTVTLLVTTDSGCTQSTTDTVHIFPLPDADFIYSHPNGVTYTQFNDLTQTYGYSIFSWFWKFGEFSSGSNDSSALQNPFHQYGISGSYEVQLRVVTDKGCTDSVSKSITAYTFLPSSLAGLRLWYNGDSAETVVAPFVNKWKDLSSSGIDALQSISSNQPEKIPNALNGYPSLRFSDDYLTAPAFSIQDRTEILIIKRSGPSANQYHNIMGYELNPYYQLYSYDTDRHLLSYIGSKGMDHQFVFSDTFQILTRVVYSDSTKFYQNGIEGSTEFFSAPLSNNPLHIGTYAPSSPQYLNGEIAEMIIYDTSLAAPDREKVETYLRTKYAPPVNLGPDVAINYGFCDLTLNAGIMYKKYFWSTGDSTPSIQVRKSGTYWIQTVDIFGYSSSDSIVITDNVNKPLQIQDTAICFGDTLNWMTGFKKTNYIFQWQDGSNDSLYRISSSGNYHYKISDTMGCTVYSDTFAVFVDTFSVFATMGPDTALCAGNFLYLKKGSELSQDYLWSGGSTNPTLTIDTAGTYWVTVVDTNGCVMNDTIIVTAIKGKSPSVDFSFSGICMGDTTAFTDLSSIPPGDTVTNWIWSFGDSSTSFLKDSKHSYQSPGVYSVNLQVLLNTGCANFSVKNIKINANPVPVFSIPTSCEKSSASFIDSSLVPGDSITVRYWNFGDPGSGSNNSSTLKNPLHTFNTAGTYPVTLIVTSGAGCSDTLIQSVAVKPAPQADFLYSSVCKGDYVSFIDVSTGGFPSTIKSWTWNFGDGTPISTNQNPAHLYLNDGLYSVSLSVVSQNGCSSIVIKSVLVNSIPVAGFTAGNICEDSPSNFSDTSKVNNSFINFWDWQITGVGSSTIKNPVFVFPDTGLFPVKLTVTSGAGCSKTIIKNIMVNELPTADFTFSPVSGAPPLLVTFNNSSQKAVSFVWDFGDSDTSTQQSPTHTYTIQNIYTVSLISNTPFGCSDTLKKQIKVLIPKMDLAVTSVNYSLSGTRLSVFAVVANFGNSDVNFFEIAAEVNGKNKIIENWSSANPFLSGSTINYLFTASFETTAPPDFVCVTVSDPNNSGTDNVPSNDKLCKAVTDQFLVMDPFPNPAVDEVTLQYVLPSAGNITIELYDERGRLVKILFDGQANKGYNELSLYNFDVTDGLYECRFVYSGTTVRKRLAKFK